MFQKLFKNIGANKLIKPIRLILIVLVVMLLLLIFQSALLYKLLNEPTSNTIALDHTHPADNQVLGISTEQDSGAGITILDEVERHPFSDVPTSHIDFTEIHYLKAKGIISGNSDGTFEPDRILTRVEGIAMVTKAAGMTINNNDSANFKDVTPQDWFYQVINTAYTTNLIDGFPDGTFRPYEPITQAGFIKLALAALNIDVSAYKTPGADWYEPYLQYAQDHQIILEAQPFVQITRSEAAEILYRILRNL